MQTDSIQTLSNEQLEQASGGVAIAVLFAAYTFVMPILALGVAVGVDEGLEASQ